MEANTLRLVGEIIGVDTNAVPANEARPVAVKIPLGTSGIEHFARLYTELLEELCQLVDFSDV